jgi:hypothetical protein
MFTREIKAIKLVEYMIFNSLQVSLMLIKKPLLLVIDRLVAK